MRIGHIDFLNCLPLTYSFNKDNNKDFLLYKDVPSKLNEAITHGDLDISPVSSIIYARNWQNFMILPKVSITTDDEVQSIILVSKKPIEEITTDKILLTTKSATSHCLLKIIMNKSYKATPNYEIRTLALDDIIPDEDATASLFIGDDALYLKHHQKENLYYYDLGHEWHKLTRTCMVFAVWIVNRNFAKENMQATLKMQRYLVNGFKHGFNNLYNAIDTLCQDKPFTREQLYEYLHVIKWDLEDRHLQALKLFYQYAYELQLIDEMPQIDIFSAKNK